MTTLPVSVVVCTKDRPPLCRSLVESILAGDGTPAELLVVDQSSDSATAAAVGQLDGVTYLRSNPTGLSAARNLGAQSAAGDVVAYCDDDLRVTSGWLAALVAPVDDGTVTTGRVLRDPEDDGGVVTALAEDPEPALYGGRLDRDVLAGGNMAIRVATLEAAGWFDERFGPGSRYPAAEDNDLGLRLLDGGAHIRYVPEALAYHRAWRSTADYPRVRFAYGRGKGAFYAKHTSGDDRYGLRRGAGDVGRRVRRLRHLPTRPVYTLGELTYATGVVAGALQWLVRERS
jgi:glycosyltransferase involved in cell wall biosynthesis